MRMIYKYELTNGRGNAIPMPTASKILSAGVQGDKIVVWADVDPDQATVNRKVFCTNTGMPTPDGEHVGTITVQPEGIVWHVFDQGETWIA